MHQTKNGNILKQIILIYLTQIEIWKIIDLIFEYDVHQLWIFLKIFFLGFTYNYYF